MASGKKNVRPKVSLLVGAAAIGFVLLLLYLSTNQSGTYLKTFAQKDDASQVSTKTKIVMNGEATAKKNVHEEFQKAEKARKSSVHTEREKEDELVKSTDPEIHRLQDFAPLLRRAATEDRTVIITEVNQAWAEPNSVLDMFLDGFHHGIEIEHLLNHVIIVAMDAVAYERCKSLHPHCYFLKHEGTNFTGEKVYMSKDYLELVWTKVKLWQFILEQGYNFLFTDADIIWIRNPFRQISVYADMTLATDVFIGSQEDHGNYPNTGIVYMKPVRKNIEMLKYWHEARKRFPPTNEQTVYDKIKRELSAKFKPKIQYVDTAYWGGFCQPKKDYNVISTFHATCFEGLAMKLSKLRMLHQEWRGYKAAFIDKNA